MPLKGLITSIGGRKRMGASKFRGGYHEMSGNGEQPDAACRRRGQASASPLIITAPNLSMRTTAYRVV